MTQVAQWGVAVQWQYKTEVDKRASEDRCIDSLRKSGAVL